MAPRRLNKKACRVSEFMWCYKACNLKFRREPLGTSIPSSSDPCIVDSVLSDIAQIMVVRDLYWLDQG